MHSGAPTILISLPQWYAEERRKVADNIVSVHDQMSVVLHFARLNMRHATGGPFAAAVVQCASGRVVSIGVNRVQACNNSCAHGEVVAIALAQAHLDCYDLGAAHLPHHALVVNWRPCVMCMGAVLWSGVRTLVIAGEGEELETITGFDEGPVHPQWRAQLERRGISVVDNVLRAEAVQLFRDFAQSGNFVYNARLGNHP